MSYALVSCIRNRRGLFAGRLHSTSSSHSWRPIFNRRACDCSGRSSRKGKPCAGPFAAIVGWSLSKRAEAVWDSIDDCVARAANDDVESWYLDEMRNQTVWCAGMVVYVQALTICEETRSVMQTGQGKERTVRT